MTCQTEINTVTTLAEYEVPITIETADHIIEEGAIATIRCDVETYIREPYSHGGSRGIATVCNSARIVSVRLGDLVLSRDQLVLWMTEGMVSLQEDQACEAINEIIVDEAA